jgi:hypothetical protein
MPPGSNIVGLSASNQPSKVVWEVDYGLSGSKFDFLSKRFPGIAFVQTGTGCHDHPVAHTSYRVVWSNVVKLLAPGALVADVAGNPSFNEKFNASQITRANPIQIDTYCKVLSTKDSIRRKTRWGPMLANGVIRWEEMTVYDMYRNEQNRARFAHYDTFLMNHVLYYYEFSEIVRLLHINPNSTLLATVHKLPGQSGSINDGEQTYSKDFVTGKVTQKNVETGESYSHSDPAPWFNQFAYADENGAIAWTINKGCEDTYILTITSTEPRLVPEECWRNGTIIFKNDEEVLVVTNPEVAEPPPAYAEEEVELTTSDLLPGYGTEKRVKFKIVHPPIYKTLRHYMINKPRNARTLTDLTAKAHREAGNNKLYSTRGKLDIDPDDLTAMIAAAWGKGAKLEADMIAFVMDDSGQGMAAVNRTLAGKSLHLNSSNTVKQIARFALMVQSVRSAREPITEVLQRLEELF